MKRSASLLARVLRSPAAHFAVIGAVLFGVASWSAPRFASPDEPQVIALTASAVEQRCEEWTRQYGSVPTAADVRVLTNTMIEEELLSREAVARGFDRHDRVVRGLLTNLGRWLDLAPGEADFAIEDQARTLGLVETDEVIRRHLVTMMRLAAAKVPLSDYPTDADVQRYYREHADRFTDSARVRLTHVYFSSDRRPTAEADARDAHDHIERAHAGPQDAAAWGDPFIRGARLASASRADLERAFGSGFAAAIDAVPLRTWSAPIRSSYGFHLVWVDERSGGTLRPLGAVRGQIVHSILAERGRDQLRASMERIRERYRIGPVPRTACTDAVF